MLNLKKPLHPGARRKTRRLRYAEVQAAREESNAKDLKRVLGGLVGPEEIRRENQSLADDELQKLQILNLEQVVSRTR